MAPTPNFGVFLDFVHPFLTEVDFNMKWTLVFKDINISKNQKMSCDYLD